MPDAGNTYICLLCLLQYVDVFHHTKANSLQVYANILSNQVGLVSVTRVTRLSNQGCACWKHVRDTLAGGLLTKINNLILHRARSTELSEAPHALQ